MTEIRIGLVGFGGVQRAFLDILRTQRQTLADQGLHITVTALSDRTLGVASDPAGLDLDALANQARVKGALASFPNGGAETDNSRCTDPNLVTVMSEAAYTNAVDGEPSLSLCRQAMANGVHVITVNKGPVAFGLGELLACGATSDAKLGLEGTVMSGTPVLHWAQTCLPGDTVTGARGILNGATNFILGQVEAGEAFDDALKTARDLGYLEADPTADIEGHDARLKVAILAKFLFGADIHPNDIPTQGITQLSVQDIRSAVADGARWKLIGEVSRQENGDVVAQVAPQCLPVSNPLAAVSGPTNALSLDTAHLGTITQTGPGAGYVETGYALFADLLRTVDS